MRKIFTICLMLATSIAYTQTTSVGIGTSTPNNKAALDITATGKGLLIPRMDSATRAAIANPPDGLMVFQTDHRKGFWYAVSNTWLYIPDKVNSGDNLGSHTATQSIETSNYDIRLAGVGDNNHGIGYYGNSGSAKNWLSQNIDGPVIYGFDGGVLGTKNGGTQSVLSWRRTGRVGINNPAPQTALDVTGTVQAQLFTYATPQTRYLSIPCDAFTSINPGTYRTYTAYAAGNGGYFTPALWLEGGTAGQEGFVSAPVNLPQGAVITGLQIIGINNDGTSINTQASLSNIIVTIGSTAYSPSILANATLTTETGGFQTASASLSHTVRNDLYSYKVTVRLNQNNGQTNLSSVRITYTVTTPE